MNRKPQAGVFAQWKPQPSISGACTGGRVFVESINSLKGTALVRFDAGEGMRSRQFCATLSDLDFNAQNGWRTL